MHRTHIALSLTALGLLSFAACRSAPRSFGEAIGGAPSAGAGEEDGGAGAAGRAGIGDGGAAGGNGGTGGNGARSGADAGGAPGATPEAGAAGTASDVGNVVTITEPVLESARMYVPYLGTIEAEGGANYSWSIASGVLPAGLALQDVGSAAVTIAGAPREAGLYPITLSVTTGTSSAEVELTLAVTHPVLLLSDREVSGVNELYLSEVGDTTAPTPVRLSASFPSGGGVASYAWSPDGSKVLYLAKQSPAGATELWVSASAAPGTAKRVSAAGTTVSRMAWLGKGNIGAYMTSVSDVYLVDLSGANPGTSKLAVSASASPYGLLASPSGTSAAVITQDTSNGEYTVRHVTWSAGTPKVVTLEAGNLASSLSYSFDGRLGFVVAATDGSGKWWDLTLGSPTPKAAQGGLWSPTAHALLYSGLGAPNALLLGTLTNGNLVYSELIENSPCSSIGPTKWSPDGKQALFSSCQNDLRGIGDVATAGVNQDFSLLPSGFSSNAPNADIDVRNPTWSRDGDWIALSADREVDGQYDLYVLRWSAPGTNYKPHSSSSAAGVTAWAFAPDSRAIAFVGTLTPRANAGLYLSKLPETGAPPLATLISEPADAVVQTDVSWLPGSRVVAYRATVAGKPQLFATTLGAQGSAPWIVPVSGVSGSGVSSYQLAPTQ